jgi:hypothetical protein
VLFPVKFQVFLVAFPPFEGALPACLLPGGVLALLILEIIRIPRPPGLHVVQLALILTFKGGAYRLIGPVFIRKKRLAADTAYLLF